MSLKRTDYVLEEIAYKHPTQQPLESKESLMDTVKSFMALGHGTVKGLLRGGTWTFNLKHTYNFFTKDRDKLYEDRVHTKEEELEKVKDGADAFFTSISGAYHGMITFLHFADNIFYRDLNWHAYPSAETLQSDLTGKYLTLFLLGNGVGLALDFIQNTTKKNKELNNSRSENI